MKTRQKILCNCGKEMVFTRQITPPNEVGLFGLIYRCPTRKGEGGCGKVKEVVMLVGQDKQELVMA